MPGWEQEKKLGESAIIRKLFYEAAFERLSALGLVYPCWCSRAERLAASAPHPGEERPMGCKCRHYSEAEKAKMRRSPAAKVIVPDAVLSVEDGHYGPYSENLAREGGDFIIRSGPCAGPDGSQVPPASRDPSRGRASAGPPP